MNNLNSDENAFIQGVWSKVRYQEYKKNEQEIVYNKLRKIRKEKIKFILAILSVLSPCFILIFILSGINLYSLIAAGILLLSAGSL
jgi:hypothetical protein